MSVGRKSLAADRKTEGPHRAFYNVGINVAQESTTFHTQMLTTLDERQEGIYQKTWNFILIIDTSQYPRIDSNLM